MYNINLCTTNTVSIRFIIKWILRLLDKTFLGLTKFLTKRVKKLLVFFSAPPPKRNTNHENRPKMKTSTNWVIYFAIVVCIIIIIGFIFIIIKFFRKQMCDFIGKKPPPQERAVSFTNIEAKSTETLDTLTWFPFLELRHVTQKKMDNSTIYAQFHK